MGGVKSTDGESSSVSFPEVVLNVAIYLGIPFVIGIAIWATGTYLCERKLGWDFRGKFLPRFGPLGMIGLLWTIVWMFADMSPQLTNGEHNILDVLLVLIPLFLYFMFMFFSTWYIGLYLVRMLKPQLIAMAFTAASNNFELAIAVATGVAGTSSSRLSPPSWVRLLKSRSCWRLCGLRVFCRDTLRRLRKGDTSCESLSCNLQIIEFYACLMPNYYLLPNLHKSL